jgi:hypothetical protein
MLNLATGSLLIFFPNFCNKYFRCDSMNEEEFVKRESGNILSIEFLFRVITIDAT